MIDETIFRMNTWTTIKPAWRECGGCHKIYQGDFGECPRCVELHKAASNCRPEIIGGSQHKGRPTLDIQEGNSEENF